MECRCSFVLGSGRACLSCVLAATKCCWLCSIGLREMVLLFTLLLVWSNIFGLVEAVLVISRTEFNLMSETHAVGLLCFLIMYFHG